MAHWRPVYAVLEREVVRMIRQRTRLVSAMVRPLIWLFVIGAGFGAVLQQAGGVSYQQFLVPGVLGMTMLFGAMLAALTMVYDKESGVMRMLIMAPFPHYWIVVAKMLAAALAAVLQALLLLVLLAAAGVPGYADAFRPARAWRCWPLRRLARVLACWWLRSPARWTISRRS